MAGKWERVRLGDAATFVNGMAFKPTDWDTTGLPIIRIQNLTEGRSEIHYFSGSCPEKYLINRGDVLISWSATLGVYIWNNEKAVLNQHIFKVVFDKLEFDKRYFVYIVGQKINEMSQNTHGSTMKHIIKKYFDAIEIPLPPLDEQKRIADVLDKASELIKKRKEQIRLMDRLAKSLFIEMFGDPVENPRGWDIKPFTTAAIIDTNMTTDFEKYANYPHIGIESIERDSGRILNYNLVKEDQLSSGKYTFGKQHIIYSKIRPNLNKVALPNFDGLCSADAYPILPKATANKYYLAYILRSNHFLDYILKHSDRTNIPKTNKKQLEGYTLPLPPLSLQNEFADRITVIEQQKALLQNGLAKMETAYKALMQEYFG
jgi:type I restriction enzyme S subunit